MNKKNLALNNIVISQPMYFPWVGILEQVQLSNIYVNYEDVQFSKGSFSNRVQVKTQSGIKWLTIPLKKLVLGQLINEVEIDYTTDWRKKHITTLNHAYSKASYKDEMIGLVEKVFEKKYLNLAELSNASLMSLVRYFNLENERIFIDSSSLGIPGSSSQRVMEVCLKLNSHNYITGHGAKNYLDHELFERNGIDVNYIDYGLSIYSQEHGEFTPYVSALDLIANCGVAGLSYINGNLRSWKDFMSIKEKENK